MKAFKFPAFRTDGMAVKLSELLNVIPENELVWSIVDFYGIGTAPNDLSMEPNSKVTAFSRNKTSDNQFWHRNKWIT